MAKKNKQKLSPFTIFMRVLGFRGYGDATEGWVLTTFLTVLFGGASVMFFVMIRQEILKSNFIELGDGVIWFLNISFFVLALFTILWRNIILIPLFCIITAAAGYGMYHEETVGKGKFFPVAVTEYFMLPEEKLKENQAMLAQPRLGIIEYHTNFKDFPYGALVSIDSKGKVSYKGKEKRLDSDAYKVLNIDRSVKLGEAGKLLAAEAENAAVLKEIPEGQSITLTGKSSKDGKAYEAVFDSATGWIAAEAVIKAEGMDTAETVSKRDSLTYDLGNMVNTCAQYLNFALLAILAFMYLTRWKKARRIYTDYYEVKRKEYPWLENWIQRNLNPAKIRAAEAVNHKLIWVALICLGVGFLGGWVLKMGFGFLTWVITSTYHVTPNPFEEALIVQGGSFLAIVIALIIIYKMWDDAASSPAIGVCPHCRCPHAWALTFCQTIVVDEITYTETTRYTDGSSTESERKGYDCKSINDYICLDCHKTEHIERSYTLEPSKYFSASKPDETPIVHNPPQEEWSLDDSQGITSLVFGVIIGVLLIAAYFFGVTGWDNYDMGKAQATHVHAEGIDSSLNGITSPTYKYITVRAKPDMHSDEVMKIQKGEFLTIVSRDGGYNLIEYKGKQGYVEVKKVQSLSKDRTATVNRNTRIGEEPKENAKTEAINEGSKVTLLGENKNGYVKVEYFGKVRWIFSSDIIW